MSVEVVFTADIASGWILYSSDFAVEIGPRPAKFTFDANPSLALLGPVNAPGIAAEKRITRSERSTPTSPGVLNFGRRHGCSRHSRAVSGRIDGQTCFEESGLCELVSRELRAKVPSESISLQ